MINVRGEQHVSPELVAAFALLACAIPALGSTEWRGDRKQNRGPGPGGVPQAVFTSHRLGTDHAEAITALDMNNDGYAGHLVSGAYWYENPGPKGGEWKRHQWREVGIVNEYVADCGEWTVDVNHDGYPDIVTASWMRNGVYWWENPGPRAASGRAISSPTATTPRAAPWPISTATASRT